MPCAPRRWLQQARAAAPSVAPRDGAGRQRWRGAAEALLHHSREQPRGKHSYSARCAVQAHAKQARVTASAAARALVQKRREGGQGHARRGVGQRLGRRGCRHCRARAAGPERLSARARRLGSQRQQPVALRSARRGLRAPQEAHRGRGKGARGGGARRANCLLAPRARRSTAPGSATSSMPPLPPPPPLAWRRAMLRCCYCWRREPSRRTTRATARSPSRRSRTTPGGPAVAYVSGGTRTGDAREGCA